jgi:rhamnose transport system permease protein
MSGKSSNNLIKNFFKRREIAILAVVILMAVVVGIINPAFFSGNNFSNILKSISILMFVGIGQMIVMISGGIDLSIGSNMAFSALSVSLLMMNYPWINSIILLILGILIGTSIGFINGLVIAKGKVPPIIATLGAMSIWRGLAVLISGGQWVSAWQMTDGFKNLARANVLGINSLIFTAIILTIVFYFFLRFNKKGREIYAYGSNSEAAKFAGINNEKVNYLAYSISGGLAGLGGILYVSRVANAQAFSAQGFEMLTIAACVVGGVSIFGGIGNITGLIVAVFLIGIVLNGMNLLKISDFNQDGVQGFIILIAVILDSILLRRNQEELRRNRRVFSEKE